MNPSTSEDILELLDIPLKSAAVGAALELGIFWLLEAKPVDVHGIASELRIPPARCSYWLQLLCDSGLIVKNADLFEPSSMAHAAIMNAYSRDTWAFLAQEARERFPDLCHLPLRLVNGAPVPNDSRTRSLQYVERMEGNPERAKRFTRMLFELHQPLAEELSGFLNMNGVHRLMDLGGGSGVASFAVLRRYPAITATVVDIENVCAAAHEIAVENLLDKRITYYTTDILRDELPGGFDMVLECDVDVYSEDLFRRVRHSLNSGGRFVIADYFAPAEGVAPRSRVHWAFQSSLTDPDFTFPTSACIRSLLEKVGFAVISENPLPHASWPGRRVTDELIVIQAEKRSSVPVSIG